MAAARSRIAAARSVENRPAARFTVAVGSYGPAASARAQKGRGSAASDASWASTNVNGSARSRAARASAAPGRSPVSLRAMAWPRRYGGRSWSPTAASNWASAVRASPRSSALFPSAARTIARSIGTSRRAPRITAAPATPTTTRVGGAGPWREGATPATSSSRATRCRTRSTTAGRWNCMSTTEWSPAAARLAEATSAVTRPFASAACPTARHARRQIATTSQTAARAPITPVSARICRMLL